MSIDITIPRLIVAGTASGVGKTTTMVALITALRRRGLKVACFKCGPDYLDPTYYRLANGEEPQNLDPWMMGGQGVKATLLETAKNADIALIEGMMGLFDGLSPSKEIGSTAQLAKWLEAPVLLVIDAAAIARSLAALVHGFTHFDPAVQIAGVWCNRVGSEDHLDLLRQTKPCRPVLGGLPRRDEDGFSERHLGLVAAQKDFLPEPALSRWAEAAEAYGNLDRILEIARQSPKIKVETHARKTTTAKPLVSIGIAQDAAFSFYYQENLRLLEANGAVLVPFSPITDQTLPEVDGLYFGGGYPELFAAELSANTAIRTAIQAFAAEGGSIYAECGGFMYLTEAIVTINGAEHPMVGWFPGKTRMCDQLQAIGYAEAVLCRATMLGAKGTRFRGHQFRYSHYEGKIDPGEPLLRLMSHRQEDRGNEGWCRGQVCGSYFHAHWASNPTIARAIVRHLHKGTAGS